MYLRILPNLILFSEIHDLLNELGNQSSTLLIYVPSITQFECYIQMATEALCKLGQLHQRIPTIIGDK